MISSVQHATRVQPAFLNQEHEMNKNNG